MKAKKAFDIGINIVFICVLIYLFITGKHMLYVGIIKSWVSKEAPKQEIAWYNTYAVAEIDALQYHKNMVILITAPSWCPPCKAMEQTTLLNPKLTALLNQHLIPVKLLDTSTEINRFNAPSFPTLIILSPEGTELFRKSGFIGGSAFLSIAEKYVQDMSHN